MAFELRVFAPLVILMKVLLQPSVRDSSECSRARYPDGQGGCNVKTVMRRRLPAPVRAITELYNSV